MQYLLPILMEKVFIVYMKFKLNLMFYILSGNPTESRLLPGHHVAEGGTPSDSRGILGRVTKHVSPS